MFAVSRARRTAVTTYSLLVEDVLEVVSKAVVVHVKLQLYEFRGFLRHVRLRGTGFVHHSKIWAMLIINCY
ncbi:hypothetical protein D0Y65_024006 [Glycine soja]|uniref:Uncharacterized protein n=1 Tax=Glycine soja TaxID=3848 RepID=A0A445J0C1_GLYSO|nr:hypothetical protein D0Y65_024006 [Glycine soja]